MRRVLITGATGLIGQRIVEKCHAYGIAVNYLTTSKKKIESRDNYKGFYWNPKSGDIDTTCFEGATAIINLAGASIAKRWTESYKKKIIESRVQSITILYNSLKKSKHNIEQFISASAIGIYPASLSTYYDEDTIINNKDSFIVDVVKQWESSIDSIKDLNIKVAKIRIGLVLSNRGGALIEMKKPISNFVGANLGSGNQWQSWIHIDDLSKLFLFILNNSLEGVYNGVAPNPITHKVFIKQIARSLDKPLWLPNIPEFIMKLILGEMHTIVTQGQRVSAKKVEDLGFQFEYYQLQSALEDLLS